MAAKVPLVMGTGIVEQLQDGDDLGALKTVSITASALTSGRVPIISTNGLLTDSANLFFLAGDTIGANRQFLGASHNRKAWHVCELEVTSGDPASAFIIRTTDFYYPTATGSGLFAGLGSATGDTYGFLSVYDAGATSVGDLKLQHNNGKVSVGSHDPTAYLHLRAGTTSIAPLKFITGSLLSTSEVGAVEFVSDKLYFTITTGAARKEIALTEGLTSGRVLFATTNGRLTDSSELVFTAGGGLGIGGADSAHWDLHILTHDSAWGGIHFSGLMTSVPLLGQLGYSGVFNSRGLNVCTNAATLSAGYAPYFGVGIARDPGTEQGPLIGLKASANGYALLVESGYVGIGLNNPTNPLEVVGVIKGTTLNTTAIVSPTGSDLTITPATGKNAIISGLKYPNADGSADQVLKTDGGGNLRWSTRPSIGSNLLINGGFDFFQRQVPATLTSRLDDTYGADRWVILTQTAQVRTARVTGASYSTNAGQIKQHQAAAQRMGVLQIVEAGSSVQMRDTNLKFTARIKCSSNQTIRAAILEWEGTADSAISDVVNDWTSGTYTKNNFYINDANFTPLGIGLVLPDASVWTDITVTATGTTSANNLIVFIWTEGTAAQNVTLDITEAQLCAADEIGAWRPRSSEQELALCQRYYEKSYAVDTVPGTVATVDASASVIWTTYLLHAPITPFKVSKRVAVTPVIYSPQDGTSGSVAEYTSAAVFVANRVVTATTVTNAFHIQSNNVFTAGNWVRWHWKADAEL